MPHLQKIKGIINADESVENISITKVWLSLRPKLMFTLGYSVLTVSLNMSSNNRLKNSAKISVRGFDNTSPPTAPVNIGTSSMLKYIAISIMWLLILTERSDERTEYPRFARYFC